MNAHKNFSAAIAFPRFLPYTALMEVGPSLVVLLILMRNISQPQEIQAFIFSVCTEMSTLIYTLCRMTK